MVQNHRGTFEKISDKVEKSKGRFAVLLLLSGAILYFGLPPFLEEGPEGGYILSKERQKDFDKKPLKSENVEVYRLLATVPGSYTCFNCEGGISTIYLNSGEVWKYGISRNGKNRYSGHFYTKNKVVYEMRTRTDILTAEKLELELIISYPLLPECQKRMKLHKIFLKRPPGNAKDK